MSPLYSVDWLSYFQLDIVIIFTPKEKPLLYYSARVERREGDFILAKLIKRGINGSAKAMLIKIDNALAGKIEPFMIEPVAYLDNVDLIRLGIINGMGDETVYRSDEIWVIFLA